MSLGSSEHGPSPVHDSPISGLARMDELANDLLPNQVKPPVMVSPVRGPGQFVDFQSFNPRTVATEAFNQIPGSVQEFALKYLYREKIETETASLDENLKPEQQLRLTEQAQRAKEAIARLRLDFEMDRDLSEYEIPLTDAIDEITGRESPITERLPDGTMDPKYAFIKSFVYLSEPDLVRKLEAERQRRQGNQDLFYSHEWIGPYAPARRYRRLLERKVAIEIENEQKVREGSAMAEKDQGEEVVVAENRKVAEIRPELTILQGSQAA